MKVNRRGQFLINPEFQLSLIALISMLAVFIIIIFYGAVWFFFYQLNQKGVDMGLPAQHVYFQFLSSLLMKMNIIMAITFIFVFIAVFIFGLLISHKIAGPMYKLKSTLVRRSKLDPNHEEMFKDIYFRHGDYFIDVQNAVNDYMANLKKRS